MSYNGEIIPISNAVKTVLMLKNEKVSFSTKGSIVIVIALHLTDKNNRTVLSTACSQSQQQASKKAKLIFTENESCFYLFQFLIFLSWSLL